MKTLDVLRRLQPPRPAVGLKQANGNGWLVGVVLVITDTKNKGAFGLLRLRERPEGFEQDGVGQIDLGDAGNTNARGHALADTVVGCLDFRSLLDAADVAQHHVAGLGLRKR